MTMFGTNMEQAIGHLFLNGVVSATDNPICNNLGIKQLSPTALPSSTGVANNLYVSLHTANPGEVGSTAEVTTAAYGGYLRSAVPRSRSIDTSATANYWTPTSSVGVYFTNVNSIQFPAMTGGAGATISHWGIWDASSGGNMLWYGPLVPAASAIATAFKVGFTTTASAVTVNSKAHGLAGGETIVLYELYNGFVQTLTGGTQGVTKVVAGGPPTETFDVTVAFPAGQNAGFLYTVTTTIAVTAGKVPNIPAGGMFIRFA